MFRVKHDIYPGARFSRLVVLKRVGTIYGKVPAWLCKCDCGREKVAVAQALRNGGTVSCGCRKAEILLGRTKHGKRHVPEYQVWKGIIRRTTSPDDKHYADYGGRGITICDQWRTSFERFYQDMGSRPVVDGIRYTIDRIDNDKGYEPGNCRWATYTEQARNKRGIRPVVRSDGVRFGTMVEAAEATGVHATGIKAACTDRQKTAGGFSWSFAEPALLSALTQEKT